MKEIKSKFKELIDSGFIGEEQHPDGYPGLFPFPRKIGKIQIYIDFRNLNVACPKDEFSLPVSDLMIDTTCIFERISFMDRFSRYNQIKMYPEDEKHTSFKMPLGLIATLLCPLG